MKRVLFAISVLVIATLACQMTGLEIPAVPPQVQPSPVVILQATPPALPTAADPAEVGSTLEALYHQVLPGVVSIRAGTAGQSLGSGFVYDSEGHIITNQHVVEGASNVEVSFPSGFIARGTVIGSDPDADIAVIKVDAPVDQIRPLAIGDSNTLNVGEQVVAIGNPFGLTGTMTLGIVSGLGRTQLAHASPEGGFFSTADIIQTDAAINPGNSGGPLFNLQGEVVGVNQSIRTENFNEVTGNAVNSGVGFSISINLVKRIVPYLIRDGGYEYPYLGISSSSELGLAEIEALGLNTYTGAYVLSVVPGGPADRAGLRGGSRATNIEGLQAGGDIITAIDGQPVTNFDSLLSYLTTNKSPGETAVLTVLRDGQPLDITVTLGARP
ncbi:MAG TPA: trypsin-like peptidase domain-containing protein [Anaerolineales bacterium]|nr:trypsin-like peptidase domain-containing protein [Anaerolineales bacterium]